MAQAKVTQFFCSRKKTFDVIQPSKKIKLDVDDEPIIKGNLKSTEFVKHLPSSVKRTSGRKRKQAAVEGNASIKSFLETASRYKLSKTFSEESTHGKVLTDSVVWQSGLNSFNEIITDCGKDLKTHSSTLGNVSLEPQFSEECTTPLKTMRRREKREQVAVSESNIMSLLESSAVSGSSKSCRKKKDFTIKAELRVAQKNARSSHAGDSNKAVESPMKSKEKLFERQSEDEAVVCGGNEHTRVKSTPVRSEMGITNTNCTVSNHKSFEKLNPNNNNSNQILGKKIQPSEKCSLNLLGQKDTLVNKHAFLKNKIRIFKEVIKNSKVTDKPDCKQSISHKESEYSLVLPVKYKQLNEMFRATETIVGMLHNRKEICTFDKLKDNVQQLTRRTFDRNLLGQIASVYPEAYTFQLEKGIGTLSSTNGKENATQLTIKPVLSPSPIVSRNLLNQNVCRMNPSTVLQRKETFYRNLVNITKMHHEDFLGTLNQPVPNAEIGRWHPKFLLNDIPDVPVFPLPEPSINKVFTAKDVLEEMHGVVCDRIEKALQSVASEESKTSVETKANEVKVLSGPLRGISKALLEKIRNKEKAISAQDMLRKPETEKRLEMLYRLPELVRILRSYFVVEKRAAIALEDIKVRVCDSFHSPISPEDVEQLLNLLRPIVPNWMLYVTIPRGTFVKIDKHIDVNNIVKAIDAEILREKS